MEEMKPCKYEKGCRCKLAFDFSVKEDDLWLFDTSYCGWVGLGIDPRKECKHYAPKEGA